MVKLVDVLASGASAIAYAFRGLVGGSHRSAASQAAHHQQTPASWLGGLCDCVRYAGGAAESVDAGSTVCSLLGDVLVVTAILMQCFTYTGEAMVALRSAAPQSVTDANVVDRYASYAIASAPRDRRSMDSRRKVRHALMAAVGCMFAGATALAVARDTGPATYFALAHAVLAVLVAGTWAVWYYRIQSARSKTSTGSIKTAAVGLVAAATLAYAGSAAVDGFAVMEHVSRGACRAALVIAHAHIVDWCAGFLIGKMRARLARRRIV